MGEKRYRALLIGNSVFAEDAAHLPRLEGPQKDVTLLHHALVNERTGLFSEESVRVLLEQPMRSMMREIHTFFAEAHRDDVLMLYYSGHGMLDAQDRLYLCASDSDSAALLPTAVSNTFVSDCMAASPTETTVVVLDCCYSGAFKGGGGVPESLAGRGRFVVSSCRGRELANAASAENGASLFTSHLVDALLGKAADRDGDGYIDLAEVYAYVQGALRDQQQSPQKRFDGERDLRIARSTNRPASRADSGVAEDHIPEQRRPVLALSETTIDLRDVGSDERLPDEHVEVYNLGEGTLDWVAQTDADWFELLTDPDGITLRLHPRPGSNRGKVLVRERTTGAVHSIRVTVSVRPTAPAPRPALQVAPAEAQFGRLWEGQQQEVVLAIVNTGSGQLQWSHQATGGFYTAHRDGDRLRLRLTGAPGRHEGAVTVSSNAGQTVVPVSADVFARSQPQPQPRPQPRPQPVPLPQPVPGPGSGPASVDPGAGSAHTLAIVALVLSFVCGLGLLIAPVSLVMATRAERRIRASSGWLGGARQVRTARILSWVAIGIGALWWVAAGINAAATA
jgi:hypothetical protein